MHVWSNENEENGPADNEQKIVDVAGPNEVTYSLGGNIAPRNSITQIGNGIKLR
jgi:hypothetical protein